MKKYVVLDSEKKILNVVLAEDVEPLRLMFPENEVIEFPDLQIPPSVGGYLLDDKFVEPQPFDSWSLDRINAIWVAPKEKPLLENNEFPIWNEDLLDWDIIQIEV